MLSDSCRLQTLKMVIPADLRFLGFHTIFLSQQEDLMFDNKRVVHGYEQASTVRQEAEMLFPHKEQNADSTPEIANKVFQLIFAGLDGATFPVGYFPTRKWTSIDILATITDAIEYLYEHGFVVSACIEYS